MNSALDSVQVFPDSRNHRNIENWLLNYADIVCSYLPWYGFVFVRRGAEEVLKDVRMLLRRVCVRVPSTPWESHGSDWV